MDDNIDGRHSLLAMDESYVIEDLEEYGINAHCRYGRSDNAQYLHGIKLHNAHVIRWHFNNTHQNHNASIVYDFILESEKLVEACHLLSLTWHSYRDWLSLFKDEESIPYQVYVAINGMIREVFTRLYAILFDQSSNPYSPHNKKMPLNMLFSDDLRHKDLVGEYCFVNSVYIATEDIPYWATITKYALYMKEKWNCVCEQYDTINHMRHITAHPQTAEQHRKKPIKLSEEFNEAYIDDVLDFLECYVRMYELLVHKNDTLLRRPISSWFVTFINNKFNKYDSHKSQYAYKGQIAIPEDISHTMNLQIGDRFKVIEDDGTKVLQRDSGLDKGAYNDLVAKTREAAKQSGLTEEGLEMIIKESIK